MKKIIFLLLTGAIFSQARIGEIRSVTSSLDVRDIRAFENQIFFATGGGLASYNPNSKEYKVFTRDNGLIDTDLSKTAFVLASKSFSTIETLSSYEHITSGQHLDNTFAITASATKAQDYGIKENHILPLDVNTGGRFSIWSAINLAFCLCHGLDAYKAFLEGGAAADNNAKNKLSENLALSLSMQDI